MKLKQFASELSCDTNNLMKSDFNTLLQPRNPNNTEFLKQLVRSLKNGQQIPRSMKVFSVTHRALKPQKISLGKRLVLEVARGETTDIATPKKTPVEITTRKKTVNIRKTNNLVCNVPESIQTDIQVDETLLRNSSKLRLLHSNKRKGFNNVLVLSSEFLLNENSFWTEENIQMNVASIYRKLSNVAELVWIVKRERTMKKLTQFCQKNQLPLDSVYVLENRKKHCISINYEPIVKDFTTTHIMSFELIRAHESMPLDEFTAFEGKLPLCNSNRVSCYLIKTDRNISHSHLLGSVLKVFIGSITPIKHDLQPIMSDYLKYLKENPNKQTRRRRGSKTSMGKRYSQPSIPRYEEEEQIDNQIDEQECQQKALKRIQQLKREWMPEMVKQNNRVTASTGESVHYIIGDMLKRNFGLLLDTLKQQQQKPVHKFVSTAGTKRRITLTRDYFSDRIEYNVPVYVCSV